MKNKLFLKIIYLSAISQWLITLGIVTVTGVSIIFYFWIPEYDQHKRQVALVHSSLKDMNQRLAVYRQAKPYYLISKQLAQQESERQRSYPMFILSYGAAIVNWQQSDTQQSATMMLGWQEFLQLWHRLTQLNSKIMPEQLQLSAQEGRILVKLTYEKS
ncbi:HofO family protein [Tatumella ptyseos]|uniref:HofO family protein n=1 Tax=Tatumella ptyseos TaxID=82987 RepID=UPI0026E928A7|nr:hypothetical protein [Tatumella ptyseos]WKX26639.1 hypothetical protein QJR74_00305 [Tatumella ptyseos]